VKALALALSGGGAHAAAHCGVLRALEREGLPVAGVAGVSGGALVAAAWAGGADLDRLVEQASGLHPWMWVRGWGGGLLSGSRLGALIDEFLPVATFEELRVPVIVLATDVDTGEPVIFREGNLRDAVRASCRLVDGGVCEVVPVRRARELAGDAGVVVAIDCNAGGRWPAADSFVAIALRAGLTVVRGRTRGELTGADLVIAPSIGESGWMRPQRIPRFAEAGEDLGVVAVRYDRPPATPGAWLAETGLETRFVTVGDHRLRYVRTGSGPAIVLIHGFASSLYTWKDVIPLLAPDHEVLALDLPGFGESDQPHDLTFEDLPRAVVGLMDRLDVERAALVGNSMGGGTAALVAARRPERVSALVLVDSAGFRRAASEHPGVIRLVRSSLGPLVAHLPVRRPFVEGALRQVFVDDTLVTDERVAEYLAPLLRSGAFPSIRSLLSSFAAHPDVLGEALAEIEAPTLVIWGREDAWIPLDYADRFVEAIPGARKVVFDGCGHMPQAERPDETGRRLREFLAAAAETVSARHAP
jgi:pimeloyl-ACP methyl ester carboxylesterase/predicted acylesterase/phospholipase RssA